MSQGLSVQEKEAYAISGLQTTPKIFPNSLKMPMVPLAMPFFKHLSLRKHTTNYQCASEMLLTKYFKAVLNLSVFLFNDYPVCVIHWPGHNRVSQGKEGNTSGRSGLRQCPVSRQSKSYLESRALG